MFALAGNVGLALFKGSSCLVQRCRTVVDDGLIRLPGMMGGTAEGTGLPFCQFGPFFIVTADLQAELVVLFALRHQLQVE